MPRPRLTPFRLLPATALVAALAAPVPARAQLDDATWIETVSLAADSDVDDQAGSELNVPEPLNGGVSGPGYAMSGSVFYVSDGPPAATSTISADHTGGLTTMFGTSYCRIGFELRVVQTAIPPAAVSSVPVTVSAFGSAQAGGDASLNASAWSTFNLAAITGPLVNWEVSVTNNPEPSSDWFGNNTGFSIAPDLVISGDLTASAGIAGDVLADNTSATATAFIDPDFGIADETIPGTSASYRDYFEIEFAPGYWALGQYPVRKATWGRIKSLYGK